MSDNILNISKKELLDIIALVNYCPDGVLTLEDPETLREMGVDPLPAFGRIKAMFRDEPFYLTFDKPEERGMDRGVVVKFVGDPKLAEALDCLNPITQKHQLLTFFVVFGVDENIARKHLGMEPDTVESDGKLRFKLKGWKAYAIGGAVGAVVGAAAGYAAVMIIRGMKNK